jgi:hypothetical protein
MVFFSGFITVQKIFSVSSNYHIKIAVEKLAIASFKAGVSNSNLSEGRIPKKKCSRGRSLKKRSFGWPQSTRKALKII